jgi:hypothetical protein
MRTTVLMLATALALGGCDSNQKFEPPPPPVSGPVPTAAASPTAPAVAPLPVAPAPDLNAVPASASAPAAPPPPAIVHWSAADWPRQEHRLAALIANAETRDTIGDTHRVVSEADARRRSCTTKPCIERAYAEEEAWLRQWEGSGSVR